MGFNLGAFAGGMAQGGVSGYKTMEDIQSQQKRDEMVALQTQQMKSEMQGKEALRSAIADQGGANSFTPNFNGTGGMDTNDVAPTPVQMSAAERRSAIEQRAIAGGADPEAAMRYTATRRTADLSDAFDTTMDKLHKESADRMSSIKATAESGGMKGLTERFGPELKKAFGHDIQFRPVPGAAGEIVAMDGKKVVDRYSSLSDATQALESLAGQEFETKFSKAMMQPGMFSSSKELSEYMMKKQELGYKGREVGIKEQLLPSEIAKNNAAANQANAHAGVLSNMLQASKDNKAAGEAMKPFIDKFSALTPEQQAGSEGQALLMQGATAGAKVSKDLTSLVTMLRKPDNAAVSTEMRTQAYTELANAGTSPEAVRAVKAKWPEVFGPSALDKAIAARTSQKPAADAAPAKPASALPTIKTPDFKVSGGRGQYAVSGLPTKFGTRADAEAAARKAQLGSREAEVAATLERDQ